MHLRDQGRLDLEQNVVDILTDYQLAPNADPRASSITVRELLQHSGGWDRSKVGDPALESSTICQALNVACPANSSDLALYMLNQPLQFAPGTAYAYSNGGFAILGRVIEKISGQSYENYVRDQVLAPFNVYDMSIGFSLLSQRGPYEAEYYPYAGEPLVASDFPGQGLVAVPYACYVPRVDSATYGHPGELGGTTAQVLHVVQGYTPSLPASGQ